MTFQKINKINVVGTVYLSRGHLNTSLSAYMKIQ